MDTPISVAIVGAGNVGFHLAKELEKSSQIQLSNIVSRSLDRAQKLISELQLSGSKPVQIDNLDEVSCDVIILSVPDQRLPDVIENSSFPKEAVVVHTSGSQPMGLLSKHPKHGVFYPFQTFTKSQQVNFKDVPIFIEGNGQSYETIQKVARAVSTKVKKVSSENRQKVHLAAVYACNFTNHLYRIAEELLADANLNLGDLEHLMRETVSKAVEISAAKAQTGPAIRGDQNIIDKHLALLQNQPDKTLVYKLLSSQIISLKDK